MTETMGLARFFRRVTNATSLARAPLVFLCLSLPLVSEAQDRGVRDQPRSVEVFEPISGYDMFTPDRHGTPANPRANELGFTLVLRMFRNVCLGLEQSKSLEEVLPEGFAAYSFTPYFFGPDAEPRGGTTILSSTGDIEQDEDGGLPAFSLEPAPGGMTCGIDWRIAEELTPESQQAIAGLLAHWMPWELALVRASRPAGFGMPALNDAIEWDRPCQGRWCPTWAYFSLGRGDVSLRMTLNITGIKGDRP